LDGGGEAGKEGGSETDMGDGGKELVRTEVSKGEVKGARKKNVSIQRGGGRTNQGPNRCLGKSPLSGGAGNATKREIGRNRGRHSYKGISEGGEKDQRKGLC